MPVSGAHIPGVDPFHYLYDDHCEYNQVRTNIRATLLRGAAGVEAMNMAGKSQAQKRAMAAPFMVAVHYEVIASLSISMLFARIPVY